MTHTHKRPRKIAALKKEILSVTAYGGYTFSELIEASSLVILECWRRIQIQYKIPCPTCPKRKK